MSGAQGSGKQVLVALEPEDADWLLERAREDIRRFRDKYEQGDRDYHTQQRAQRIAEALGVRLGINNRGDNTYDVTEEPIHDPETPETPVAAPTPANPSDLLGVVEPPARGVINWLKRMLLPQ